jgi:hypothetical protein
MKIVAFIFILVLATICAVAAAEELSQQVQSDTTALLAFLRSSPESGLSTLSPSASIR